MMKARKSCASKTAVSNAAVNGINVKDDEDENLLICEYEINGKTAFKCRECDFITHIRKIILRHLLKHKLHCDTCPFSTFIKFKLVEHRERIHSITASSVNEDGFIIIERADDDSDDNHNDTDNETATKSDQKQSRSVGFPSEVSSEATPSYDLLKSKSLDSYVVERGRDGLYHCMECLFSSSHESSIRRHHAHHLGGGPVKCQHCSFTSTSHHRIATHVSLDHYYSNSESNLSSVSGEYKEASSKFNSGLSSSVDKPIILGKATETLSREYSGPSKVKITNGSEESISIKERPICCSPCRKIFKTAELFSEHRSLEHNNAPMYLCDLCLTYCLTAAGFERHMQRVHETCNSEGNLKRLSPLKISKSVVKKSTSGSEEDLSLQGAGSENNYANDSAAFRGRCSVCRICISSRSALIKHCKSNHSNKKILICPKCGFPFNTTWGLFRHVTNIHGESECSSIDVNSAEININGIISDDVSSSDSKVQCKLDTQVISSNSLEDFEEICTVVNVEEGTVTRIHSETKVSPSASSTELRRAKSSHKTGKNSPTKSVSSTSSIGPPVLLGKNSLKLALKRKRSNSFNSEIESEVIPKRERQTKKFRRNVVDNVSISSDDFYSNDTYSIKGARNKMKTNFDVGTSEHKSKNSKAETYEVESTFSEQSSLAGKDSPAMFCTYCSFRTKSEEKLVQHIAKHKVIFGCSCCEFTSEDRAAAVKHLCKHPSKMKASLSEKLIPVHRKCKNTSSSERSKQDVKYSKNKSQINSSTVDDVNSLLDTPKGRNKMKANRSLEDLDTMEESVDSNIVCNKTKKNSNVKISNSSLKSSPSASPTKKIGTLEYFKRIRIKDVHVYCCSVCPFQCYTALEARTHSELCAKENMDPYFVCPHCTFRSRHYSSTYKHCKAKHKGKMGIISRKNFKREEIPDKSESQISVLGRQTAVPSKILTWVQQKFRNQMKEGFYKCKKCSVCGFRSDREHSIFMHIKALHPNDNGTVITMNDKEAQDSLPRYISSLECMSLHLKTYKSKSESKHCKELKVEKSSKKASETPSDNFETKVCKERGLRQLKCSECDARFEWHRSIKRHIASNHPHATVVALTAEMAARPYQCEDLPGNMTSNSLNETCKFSCDICSFQSNTLGRIEEHKKFIHGDETIIGESVKGAVSNNESARLSENLKSSPNKSKKKKKAKINILKTKALGSKVLGKNTSFESSLTKKIRKIGIRNKYKCALCPFVTDRKSGFLQHSQSHKKRKGFTKRCKYCPFYAKAEGNLNTHMKLHKNVDNIDANSNAYSSNMFKDAAMIEPSFDSSFLVVDKQQLIAQKSATKPLRDHENMSCNQSVASVSSARTSSTSATPSKKSKQDVGRAVPSNGIPSTMVKSLSNNDSESKPVARKTSLSYQGSQISSKTSNRSQKSAGQGTKKSRTAKSSDVDMSDFAGHELICEFCPYSTTSLRCFASHKNLHGAKLKFECEFCNYSAMNYFDLQAHKWVHLLPHPDLRYSQSMENLRAFPQVEKSDCKPVSNPLLTHPTMQRPSYLVLAEETSGFNVPARMFSCDKCPFRCSVKTGLIKHYQHHTVCGSFSCPFCSYQANASKIISDHVLLHFNLPGSELNAQPKYKHSDTLTVSVVNDIKQRSMKDPSIWYTNKSKKSTIIRKNSEAESCASEVERKGNEFDTATEELKSDDLLSHESIKLEKNSENKFCMSNDVDSSEAKICDPSFLLQTSADKLDNLASTIEKCDTDDLHNVHDNLNDSHGDAEIGAEIVLVEAENLENENGMIEAPTDECELHSENKKIGSHFKVSTTGCDNDIKTENTNNSNSETLESSDADINEHPISDLKETGLQLAEESKSDSSFNSDEITGPTTALVTIENNKIDLDINKPIKSDCANTGLQLAEVSKPDSNLNNEEMNTYKIAASDVSEDEGTMNISSVSTDSIPTASCSENDMNAETSVSSVELARNELSACNNVSAETCDTSIEKIESNSSENLNDNSEIRNVSIGTSLKLKSTFSETVNAEICDTSIEAARNDSHSFENVSVDISLVAARDESINEKLNFETCGTNKKSPEIETSSSENFKIETCDTSIPVETSTIESNSSENLISKIYDASTETFRNLSNSSEKLNVEICDASLEISRNESNSAETVNVETCDISKEASGNESLNENLNLENCDTQIETPENELNSSENTKIEICDNSVEYFSLESNLSENLNSEVCDTNIEAVRSEPSYSENLNVENGDNSLEAPQNDSNSFENQNVDTNSDYSRNKSLNDCDTSIKSAINDSSVSENVNLEIWDAISNASRIESTSSENLNAEICDSSIAADRNTTESSRDETNSPDSSVLCAFSDAAVNRSVSLSLQPDTDIECTSNYPIFDVSDSTPAHDAVIESFSQIPQPHCEFVTDNSTVSTQITAEMDSAVCKHTVDLDLDISRVVNKEVDVGGVKDDDMNVTGVVNLQSDGASIKETDATGIQNDDISGAASTTEMDIIGEQNEDVSDAASTAVIDIIGEQESDVSDTVNQSLHSASQSKSPSDPNLLLPSADDLSAGVSKCLHFSVS